MSAGISYSRLVELTNLARGPPERLAGQFVYPLLAKRLATNPQLTQNCLARPVLYHPLPRDHLPRLIASPPNRTPPPERFGGHGRCHSGLGFPRPTRRSPPTATTFVTFLTLSEFLPRSPSPATRSRAGGFFFSHPGFR